jgi:hypothetical protein
VDPVQLLIGMLMAIGVLYAMGRIPKRNGAAAPARRERRPGRQPLTRLEDVVPVPHPDRWLALPDPSAGLDGELDESAKVGAADRPYARTTCPSCGVELDPLPKAKKRCTGCPVDIFVRSGPDGIRYLLAAGELEAFQERWATQQQERWTQARRRQDAALEVWHRLLGNAGFAVGPQDLDVVGESFYHVSLAGIHAALHQAGDAKPGSLLVPARGHNDRCLVCAHQGHLSPERQIPAPGVPEHIHRRGNDAPTPPSDLHVVVTMRSSAPLGRARMVSR